MDIQKDEDDILDFTDVKYINLGSPSLLHPFSSRYLFVDSKEGEVTRLMKKYKIEKWKFDKFEFSNDDEYPNLVIASVIIPKKYEDVFEEYVMEDLHTNLLIKFGKEAQEVLDDFSQIVLNTIVATFTEE